MNRTERWTWANGVWYGKGSIDGTQTCPGRPIELQAVDPGVFEMNTPTIPTVTSRPGSLHYRVVRR